MKALLLIDPPPSSELRERLVDELLALTRDHVATRPSTSCCAGGGASSTSTSAGASPRALGC
jgi:hypothetical protein